MEYRAFVKDILKLSEEKSDLQIIPYNPERHEEILKSLYKRYAQKELEKNWIPENEIYLKGIYLLKAEGEYTAYVITNLHNGKIYIWSMEGEKDEEIKLLTIKVAEDLDALSYEKVYMKGIDEDKKENYLNMGFKETEI